MQDFNQMKETLWQKIKELSTNFESFQREISQFSTIRPEIKKLTTSIFLIKCNFEKFGSVLRNSKIMAMQGDVSNSGWYNNSEPQLTELEVISTKYENLQKEWDNQQEHLGRLQGEVFKLRNQLQMQSSFCASLGSVMGNLVWKASRLQPVVELFLTTNKLTDFFSVVSGTLISFTSTYCREIPDVTCNETQFILSMCGIIANVAAVAEGRQYISTDLSGKEMIDQIIQVLPKIPTPSGDPLKRILLMVLYNIGINQNGLVLIQEQKPLLVTLSRIVICDRTPELKALALRLLESITFDIPNALVFLKFQQYIPIDKLHGLKESPDAEMRQYAINILTNLKKAEMLYSGSGVKSTSYITCEENIAAQSKMSNNPEL